MHVVFFKLLPESCRIDDDLNFIDGFEKGKKVSKMRSLRNMNGGGMRKLKHSDDNYKSSEAMLVNILSINCKFLLKTRKLIVSLSLGLATRHAVEFFMTD